MRGVIAYAQVATAVSAATEPGKEPTPMFAAAPGIIDSVSSLLRSPCWPPTIAYITSASFLSVGLSTSIENSTC